MSSLFNAFRERQRVKRADALFRESISLWTVQKNREAAIVGLTRVLGEYPSLPVALYNRALIRAELGEDALAVEDMHALEATGDDLANRLTGLFAIHVGATISIGVGEFNSGRLERAEQFFTRAITYNPFEAIAFNNRGITRRAIGNELGAATDLTTAVALGWSGPHVMTDTAGAPPGAGA